LDIVDVNEINIDSIEEMSKNGVFNKQDQGRKVILENHFLLLAQ